MDRRSLSVQTRRREAAGCCPFAKSLQRPVARCRASARCLRGGGVVSILYLFLRKGLPKPSTPSYYTQVQHFLLSATEAAAKKIDAQKPSSVDCGRKFSNSPVPYPVGYHLLRPLCPRPQPRPILVDQTTASKGGNVNRTQVAPPSACPCPVVQSSKSPRSASGIEQQPGRRSCLASHRRRAVTRRGRSLRHGRKEAHQGPMGKNGVVSIMI